MTPRLKEGENEGKSEICLVTFPKGLMSESLFKGHQELGFNIQAKRHIKICKECIIKDS